MQEDYLHTQALEGRRCSCRIPSPIYIVRSLLITRWMTIRILFRPGLEPLQSSWLRIDGPHQDLPPLYWEPQFPPFEQPLLHWSQRIWARRYNVDFVLDSQFDDCGVVDVRNEWDNEIVSLYDALKVGGIGNVERYGSRLRQCRCYRLSCR